jgi:hypothetical protein
LFERITGLADVEVSAAWIMADNLIVELWQYPNPPTLAAEPLRDGAPGYRHLGFACTDLHAEIRRLQACAIQLDEPREVAGLRSAQGRDPDGNLFVVTQMPAAPTRLLCRACRTAHHHRSQPPFAWLRRQGMITPVDRRFGEQFLRSIDDFNAHGVHLLFNEWWETAPRAVIEKYVDAITSHPEQGPLAREAWFAEPQTIEALSHYAPGTLGAAYHAFMVDNGLAERLALGYRELHEEYARSGRIAAMPPIIQYKVLRGYQTHDLHHVLTNYPATPFGEIALQAFGLAQMDFLMRRCGLPSSPAIWRWSTHG